MRTFVYSLIGYSIILFCLKASAMISNVSRSIPAKKGEQSYDFCLNESNKLSTPDERDRRKIECLRRHKTHLSINKCYQLSQVLEYSSIKDELLGLCLSNNFFATDFRTCVDFSAKMIYANSADSSIWDCLQNKNSKLRLSDCKWAAQKMRLPHNKTTAYFYCEYQR